MPPGLRPDADGMLRLPLHYSRRDWANAEWKLKIPLLGPRSAEFWQSGVSTFQLGVLLYVGLQRALPKASVDDVQDLIPFDGYGEIEAEVMGAIEAAMPKPKESEQAPEVGEAADPLAPTSGGSEPGPSPATTSD